MLAAHHAGSIYRIGPDGSHERMADGYPFVRRMAWGPDGLVLLQDGTIHVLAPDGAAHTHSEGWHGAEGLARAGDTLYVVHGGKLHQLVPEGSTALLAGWGSLAGLAGTPSGHLLSMAQGILYRGPAKGEANPLCGGFTDVEAVTCAGEDPYIMAGGTLHRVEAEACVTLGSGWTSVEAMAGTKEAVYIIARGLLYRVLQDGTWTVIGNDWAGCHALAGWPDDPS